MNHFFKIIILLSITVAFFSCSDEFVDEKVDVSGVAVSAIIISPEWDADDYEFKCNLVKNADFSIISKPDWLILESKSGKFVESIATIRLSANREPLYSEIGFYVDQMLISSGGKKYAIPLYYVTEGNPTVEVNQAFEFGYFNYNNQMQISNSGNGILLWDIVSMPRWLTINMDQFDPMSVIMGQETSAYVTFILDTEAATQGDLNSTIILKTNDENNPLVEIAVSAKLGAPDLSLDNERIDFGSSATSKTFVISNYGDGLLRWSFEELPEWLSVTPTSGMNMPFSSNDIIFTCNRSKLQSGTNSAIIKLKSNVPNKSSVDIVVTARVPGVNPNVRPLEGNIVNATFDKNTNVMYYITSQPNKLVAFDVTSKTVLHEVALSKAPTCLAIREDFKQALLGHGGMISIVDLTNFTVFKTYELNYTVYDIEWAEGDWFCYTIANRTLTNLLWKNINTDETYETTSMLGTADLVKVPNQPYIIASRANVSPSGIFVFDITSKTQKSYAHESIGNDFWFSDGSELMITEYSDIIRTSAITTITGQGSGPTSIGELKIGTYPYVTWWADWSAANHSVWAILSSYTHALSPPVAATFYQFEDNDYTLVKSYTYDNMYQPNLETTEYEVEARYLFANSLGNELSVLRKGKDNSNWSVEFIPVH